MSQDGPDSADNRKDGACEPGVVPNEEPAPDEQDETSESEAAEADEELAECDDPTADVQEDSAPDKRASERALVERLAENGFQGPEWLQYAGELARYGSAVLDSWLRTQKIVHQCRRKGWRIQVPPDGWSDDHARKALADDTVVAGLKLFRYKGLICGGWNPEGGASLKTYFLGACVLVFPDENKKYCTALERRQEHLERLQELDEDRTGDTSPDPAETLAIRVESSETRAIFDTLREQEKQALELQAEGYTYEQIGQLMAEREGKPHPFSRDQVRGWARRGRERFRRNSQQREEGS